MATNWIGVITDAGAALLADWSLGSETLYIDGVTVGSGITQEANMRQATDLANEKDTGSLVSARRIDGGVEFKAQIGPASAEVGAYTAHEVGLWAHLGSGESTLIALHQDSGDGIPVPLASASPNFIFSLYMTHAISNTGSLSVTIDTGAYVSESTLQEAIDRAYLTLNFGTVTSLPLTITDARIEAGMIVVGRSIGDEEAFSSLSVEVSEGSAKLTGTVVTDGSSTVVVYLAHSDVIAYSAP